MMDRIELLRNIEDYVSTHIGEFHQSRIDKLKTMHLSELLKRKNPYLYKAKDLSTPQAVVENLASAFLSSAEETLFGDWLEQLAIYIAGIMYGGHKSTALGIDLELEKNGVHYAVSIKSGPNWSNSSSYNKLIQNFQQAERVFKTSGNKIVFEAVEGICYGRSSKSEKSGHLYFCGARFWAFISGYDKLYLDIIEPLGSNAKEKNAEYKKEYNRMITRFTKEFSIEYCTDNGDIDWEKIVNLNSGIIEKKMTRKTTNKKQKA